MNGGWFPWAEYANGNQPDDYVTSWRHVHDIFTSVGADNATGSGAPTSSTPAAGPLARYYPGGDYVDWTCLDGFNWAKNGVNPAPWISFDEIFGPSYRAIVNKIAPEKPMLLGEFASGGAAKAKSKWIKDMFEHLRDQIPPHPRHDLVRSDRPRRAVADRDRPRGDRRLPPRHPPASLQR